MIQFPFNLQNLNRYSYVLNNPLSFTDPNGFITDALNDYLEGLENDSSTSTELSDLIAYAQENMATDDDDAVLEWLNEQSSSLAGQKSVSDDDVRAFQEKLSQFRTESDKSDAVVGPHTPVPIDLGYTGLVSWKPVVRYRPT